MLFKSSTHIIQLDKSEVKVMDELEGVLIQLTFNMQVHQTIYIFVIDVSKACNVLRSKEWVQKSKYFLQLSGLIYGLNQTIIN
jgi:hypothetical protein